MQDSKVRDADVIKVANALIAEWREGNSAKPGQCPFTDYFVACAGDFARAAIAALRGE